MDGSFSNNNMDGELMIDGNIRIEKDIVTDYWFAYMGNKEISKAKTLVKCLKSLTAYVKGQE